MHSKADKTCILENYNIVNDLISSKIKETLIVEKSSHNLLNDKKYLNEHEHIYETINEFLGKF